MGHVQGRLVGEGDGGFPAAVPGDFRDQIPSEKLSEVRRGHRQAKAIMGNTHLLGLIRLSAVIVALQPLYARGDALPGLPQGELIIHICFENLDDYPNYDFYLRYGRSSRNPYADRSTLTRLSSGIPAYLRGEGARISDVYLLVVPSGQEPIHSKAGTDLGVGMMQSRPLEGLEPGSGITGQCNGYCLSYRVRIQDDTVHVVKVSSELIPMDWVVGHLCSIIAAVVISGFFVIVVLRKFRRNDATGTSSTENALQ